MAKDPKRKKTDSKGDDTQSPRKGGGQSNSFATFLKKRAPIYLGLVGLFLVFAVPSLTGKDLESLLPDEEILGAEGVRVLEEVMHYRGQDDRGITILDAIDITIKRDFSDDIYDDDSTMVLVEVTDDNGNSNVYFTFVSDEGNLEYAWSVDAESGHIDGILPGSQGLVDLVEYTV